MLRGCTHRMWATFSLAPAFGPSSNSVTQMKIGQAFGNDAFALTVSPKIWYDIPVSEKLGIYLSPSTSIGLALRVALLVDESPVSK